MDPPGLGLQRASRRTLGGTSQGEVKQSRLNAVAGRGDTRRGAGAFQGKNVLTAIPLSLFRADVMGGLHEGLSAECVEALLLSARASGRRAICDRGHALDRLPLPNVRPPPHRLRCLPEARHIRPSGRVHRVEPGCGDESDSRNASRRLTPPITRTAPASCVAFWCIGKGLTSF